MNEILIILTTLIVLTFLNSSGLAQNDYQAEIAKWRANREKNLKSDDGWLTLSGLFWLKDGENTVGTQSTGEHSRF